MYIATINVSRSVPLFSLQNHNGTCEKIFPNIFSTLIARRYYARYAAIRNIRHGRSSIIMNEEYKCSIRDCRIDGTQWSRTWGEFY